MGIALAPFIENLERAVCVFDNQILDGNSRLVPQDDNGVKKKSKRKAKQDDSTSDGDNSFTIEKKQWSVDLLFRDEVYNDVDVVNTRVRMRLVGKLACRAFVTPSATAAIAEAAIKQDLIRSLTGRTSLHCDSLVGDEKGGTMSNNSPVIHEPPRRVFVNLPDSDITISDYLYPGEGTEDCVGSVKELFGFTPTDEGIEDDVEIVASPKEIDGSGQSTDKKSAKRPTGGLRCGAVQIFLSVAVASISAAFAYFS